MKTTERSFEEIDWSVLEIELSKKLHFPIKFNTSIYDKLIRIASENLSSLTGILVPIFEDLRVDNFGGSTINQKNDTIWINIHFSYSFNKGGSNGVKLGDAIYHFNTKKWDIEFIQ